MSLKCLIVDDEPIARQILEKYCSYLPELEIVASCKDALEAKRIVAEHAIDVIFLDINMPVLDGMAFANILRDPPLIVFTTAYKEFAHEAFNVSACDYLLKPFSLERFIVAVDKVKEKLAGDSQTIPTTTPQPFIYIKSDGKIYKVLFDDIKYAEASGNNLKIITERGVLVATMTFVNLEETLPRSIFARLHRSFIVNKSKISHIEGNRVFVGSAEIPIGSHYRDDFFREIGIR